MLRDTQIALATSLLAGDDDAAASRIRAGKLSARRRLEIYRHNVYSNLRGTLKDIYPVVVAIVGDAFFHHAADLFVQTTPSRSGDLNQFGSEWAAFLGAYPHARELPYLPDVARLEWAWHEAFHAGETPTTPAFDLARLAAVAPEKHGALCFDLHPSVRLLKSEFPVLRIWEVNQPGYDGEIEVNWDVPAETLLIRRDADDGVSVLIEPIGAAEHAFLHALQRSVTLDAAAEEALAIDPGFELQPCLIGAFQSGVISDLRIV